MYRANHGLPVLLHDLLLWHLLGFFFSPVLTVPLHSPLQSATDPRATCQRLKFCSMWKIQLEDCATEHRTHGLFKQQLLVHSEGMCWVITCISAPTKPVLSQEEVVTPPSRSHKKLLHFSASHSVEGTRRELNHDRPPSCSSGRWCQGQLSSFHASLTAGNCPHLSPGPTERKHQPLCSFPRLTHWRGKWALKACWFKGF